MPVFKNIKNIKSQLSLQEYFLIALKMNFIQVQWCSWNFNIISSYIFLY